MRLFQNLIGNAVKFRSERPLLIEISSVLAGGEWVFSVKDNGIGFDMKYANQIFEIFKRLNSNHAYTGTGVGLAVCKKIVERHGGKIWVESEPGSGTTFSFTLPALQEKRLRSA